MITRAYIVGAGIADSAATGADVVIGGLPVLLRLALSLQDAGVDDLVLVGVPDLMLRQDNRIRARISSAARGSVRADRGAIVAHARCVCHPGLLHGLTRIGVAPNDIVPVVSADAVLFVCGTERVCAAIDGILTGGSRDVSGSPVVVRSPEFVMCPRTPAEREATLTLLLRSLEKPSDGLVSRHLHRPVSRAITRRLLTTGITPNHMTLVAAAWGAAGALVALRGGYWYLLLGAALFEAQNILDGCDGEIARLKHLRSRGGEWLDQITDDVLNIVFLVAVAAGLTRDGHAYAGRLATVAVGAQVIHLIGLYAGLAWTAGGTGSVARLRWWIGGGNTRTTVGDLTRRDVISFAYLVAAIFNVIAVAFLWHVLVTIGSAVVTTLQWIVWGGPEVTEVAEVRVQTQRHRDTETRREDGGSTGRPAQQAD